jgi:hypothetical protein
MLISQHIFITTIKTRSISDISQCRYVYEEHNSDVTKITVSTILPSIQTHFSCKSRNHIIIILNLAKTGLKVEITQPVTYTTSNKREQILKYITRIYVITSYRIKTPIFIMRNLRLAMNGKCTQERQYW